MDKGNNSFSITIPFPLFVRSWHSSTLEKLESGYNCPANKHFRSRDTQVGEDTKDLHPNRSLRYALSLGLSFRNLLTWKVMGIEGQGIPTSSGLWNLQMRNE